jgi:superfamily II DNA or RNA helicase/HKD family nuclease
MSELVPGIYDRIIDLELAEVINSADIKPILRAIDDEESPAIYSLFLANILKKKLRSLKPDKQIQIFNDIIDLLCTTDGERYLDRKKILGAYPTKLLLSTNEKFKRPTTPLYISSLLTGQGNDPPLNHELRMELATADKVDILVSFIKWSGLRLLFPSFQILADNNIPVRIITTSYMGVSEPEALQKLAEFKNVTIRVSYDPDKTRLHAKAYHFYRNSGFSTAYIGSANMTHAAMTEGLEWTVKVTAQDMPHILERFTAEFETYWESPEYQRFDSKADFNRFKNALDTYKKFDSIPSAFFAELTPRVYQERILEELIAERRLGNNKNLIVAATGTGKTVISAFDYKRYSIINNSKPSLLYIAHRKEILEQALSCFRMVLQDQNFGSLFVDGINPFSGTEAPLHIFASIQSVNSKQIWKILGKSFFNFIIIDEVHHSSASSYRSIFSEFTPEILLGLTATPERMDGESILPDFNYRITSEIRLPEALEERLLCPFHYFGITDNIQLKGEQFWKNGKFDLIELENVYTGDDITAKQRVNLIYKSINHYQPNSEELKAVGFCVSVKHAKFMSENFQKLGIDAETILGETDSETRRQRIIDFKQNKIKILFTVDIFNEGVDIPEINTVLFLRPTESLTIFLQQLGRGLRHAPNKDALTVLDFIGQTHKKYRIDRKFISLLKKKRNRLLDEVESEFPNLPSGSVIQLERIARETILEKIKQVYNDLIHFIPETIETWSPQKMGELTFFNFIRETSLSPIAVLKKKTWSQWKAIANKQSDPMDIDILKGKSALLRISLRSSTKILNAMIHIADGNDSYIESDIALQTSLHYLMWGEKGLNLGIQTWKESLEKWKNNPSVASDAKEIAEWRLENLEFQPKKIKMPIPCDLELHSYIGSSEIKASLGLATIKNPGPTGQGVIHIAEKKIYVHLVTFQKEERDFSITTLYKDYPISKTKLHWESQSTISIDSQTAKNYFEFQKLGYTILFFARVNKNIEGETAPFLFLGQAKSLIEWKGERPISMIWELEHPMPSAFFEEAKMV